MFFLTVKFMDKARMLTQDLIQFLNFWFRACHPTMNEVLIKPGAWVIIELIPEDCKNFLTGNFVEIWNLFNFKGSPITVIIELMPVKVLPLWDMWFISRTCVSSGTALVPSLTTSERWEGWEVWGLEPLNYNTHVFLKRNLPEKGLSPLVLPDDKSGGFRIGLIFTCMVYFLPSHVYSLGKLMWCDKALMFTRNHPALLLTIKAVL